MRIIIFGAGAVGSVIGGRLYQGGADVVLVARPAHAEAINAHGLLLRTGDGEERIAVRAVSSLDELTPGSDDAVVITAKTQDVGPIHDALLRWNPNVAVFCGTNGVEHERMALRRFARVYAMVIQLPATFEVPGEVTALCSPSNAIIDVGRYPAGVDDTARAFARIADSAPHILCEADDAIMEKKHQKVLVNLGNAAEAAIGLGGRGSVVARAAMAEGKSVYDAVGIPTPDRRSAEEQQRYAERMATMQFKIPDGQSFLGGSTWQSLAKGSTSVETDYFNGEIVLLGRLHGIATPHNEFLQNLSQELLAQRAEPGSLTAEAFEARWRDAVGDAAGA